MVELQVVCYVVGLALVWAGAPAEHAIGAWGLGFAMVWRPGWRKGLKPGERRSRLKPAAGRWAAASARR